MTAIEIASLVVSAVSVTLAIVAIWLSIVFYKMSSELSESTKEAAKGIGASVERLEKLFDKLYADTFAMMKESFSDMRQHAWPNQTGAEDKVLDETNKKIDEKLGLLTTHMKRDLSNILDRQRTTDVEVSSLKTQVTDLVERAIAESRQMGADAVRESLRDQIIEFLQRSLIPGKRVEADSIVQALADRFGSRAVIEELRAMLDQGIIEASPEIIVADTRIKLRE